MWKMYCNCRSPPLGSGTLFLSTSHLRRHYTFCIHLKTHCRNFLLSAVLLFAPAKWLCHFGHVHRFLLTYSQSSFNSSDFSPSSRDDCCILRRSASQHYNRYGDDGFSAASRKSGWKFGRSQICLNWLDAVPVGAEILIMYRLRSVARELIPFDVWPARVTPD